MGRTRAARMQARRLARLGKARALRRSLPFSITFIVTNVCNLHCHYCNIPKRRSETMSTAQLCAALDQLEAAGMARAAFSGGEAFLRKDIAAIVGHARSLGLYTSLNTNGWFGAERLDELGQDLDMVMVSLDGPRELHDQVRGRPESWDRAMDTLRGARARGITPASIMVVGPWNQHEVPAMFELAEREGFWLYLQPAHSDCFDLEAGLAAAVDTEAFSQLADAIARARRRGQPAGASGAFVRRLRRGPRFSDCGRCAAGRYFATVLPDGTIVPCHLTSGQAIYPNGLERGFDKAFADLPRPKPGPGCAIAPYQESDLIFHADPRAVAAALRKVIRGQPPARVGGAADG